MAGKILNSYPDYAKSTPAYTAGIVEVLARYPQAIQEALADPMRGVRSRCTFLPTIADIVKIGDEFTAEQARQADSRKRYAGLHRTPVEYHATSFNPFPKLTEAFYDEPHLLQKPFDVLLEAYKRLHFGSYDETRAFLLASEPYQGKAAESERRFHHSEAA